MIKVLVMREIGSLGRSISLCVNIYFYLLFLSIIIIYFRSMEIPVQSLLTFVCCHVTIHIRYEPTPRPSEPSVVCSLLIHHCNDQRTSEDLLLIASSNRMARH